MKKLLSFICMTLISFATFAQKANIKFETETHDFCEIQEKDGSVTYVFNYQNTGDAPLVITQVKASCGCTTPEWTQTPVRAGESGSIKVTFNPANRPGSFNKTISVQSNASKPLTTLRISGKVLQRPKTLEETYPVVMDSIRLMNNHIPFTKIKPTEVKTEEVKVINNSSVDVTPNFINVPAHITIVSNPTTIKAGSEAVFQATYDASKKNDWGYVSDRIYVTFSDKKEYHNTLTLSATIEEDFSNVDEKDAPVFEVNEKSHDFGDISQSNKVETDFVVTNTGKDNLIIRKVKASCGCTAVTPQKTILAKGESTNIHVTFDPRGKSGRQSKTITVITNDPKNSNVLLRISANILTAGAELKK